MDEPNTQHNLSSLHKKSGEKVLDWATSTETEGFSKKKKVYEAKPSSRGFIFSMDETSRHLCVLFWFCVPFFMCQQLLAALKEAVQRLSEKILMHAPPSRMKKTTEFILDILFYVFIVAHYLLNGMV